MVLRPWGAFFSGCSLFHPPEDINKDRTLGKPNYSFQKRQKELAKKKKKEEKDQRKLEKKASQPLEETGLLEKEE